MEPGERIEEAELELDREIFEISCKRLVVNDRTQMLLKIENVNDLVKSFFRECQEDWRRTFINALSHERITPINKLLNLSRQLALEELDTTKIRAMAEQSWQICEKMRLLTVS